VPSFDVASCCSTTRPEASNIAGSRWTSVLRHHEQRCRLDEIREGEEVPVRVRGCGNHADGAKIRRRHFVERPSSILIAVAPQLTPDVVQDVEQQVVARGRHAIDGLTRTGLGHELKGAFAGEKIVDRGRNERTGRPGLAADGPRIAHVHHELALHETDIGVGGGVDLYDLPLVVEVLGPVVEVRPVRDHEVAAPAVIRAE
jgi:hypothetical protein